MTVQKGVLICYRRMARRARMYALVIYYYIKINAKKIQNPGI